MTPKGMKKSKTSSQSKTPFPRVPVKTILQMYQDGYTIEEIMEEHPTLTQEDIEAAIRSGRPTVHRE